MGVQILPINFSKMGLFLSFFHGTTVVKVTEVCALLVLLVNVVMIFTCF